MQELAKSIAAATDGYIAQDGLPLSWIVVLVIGGGAVLVATTWSLVHLLRRPDPWERSGSRSR